MTDAHDAIHVPPDPLFHLDDFEPESHPARKRLPIPDLRFEQVYLKRIQHCIHVAPLVRDAKEKGPAVVDTEDAEFTTSTHVTPLIGPSQRVVRVEWGKILYITLRDQVVVPLLQGMLWGMVGTYYRPFVAYAKESLHGTAVSPRPVEGEGVSWLRRWLRRLGFSSITVGPPSF